MTRINFFRSIFTIAMIGLIGLVFVGCSDQSADQTQKQQEFITTDLGETGARTTSSVGKEHNRILDEIFNHLNQVKGLNRENAREHIHGFFDTHYEQNLATLAIECYDKYSDPNYNIYEGVSPNIMTEILNLENMLDNSDFAYIQEFKNAVLTYTPTTLLSVQEQVIWKNYTDVLVHSFEYWDANLDQWNNLLGQNQNITNNECSGVEGWFKRAWCNVKRFVSTDASAAKDIQDVMAFLELHGYSFENKDLAVSLYAAVASLGIM